MRVTRRMLTQRGASRLLQLLAPHQDTIIVLGRGYTTGFKAVIEYLARFRRVVLADEVSSRAAVLGAPPTAL